MSSTVNQSNTAGVLNLRQSPLGWPVVLYMNIRLTTRVLHAKSNIVHLEGRINHVQDSELRRVLVWSEHVSKPCRFWLIHGMLLFDTIYWFHMRGCTPILERYRHWFDFLLHERLA